MTISARLRWAVLDGWTIAQRALLHWSRQPGTVITGLLFPVLMVVMFGYLLGGQMEVPSGADYFDFLLPGMFVLTMVFGIEATMVAINADAAKGVTDRFRSMPMAPSAVVVGRSVADMLHSVLGLAVMIACGLVVGWRWDDGAGGALAAVALLLLLRFALIWVGIYLGLLVKTPEAVVAVQILVWPLGFLSSAFVAPSTMPGWLGTIAEWNPMSSTVTAIRDLFGNPGWTGDSWVAQHAELMAVVWPLVIVAIFFPLSVQRYRALSR
jgi:ABC transporter DrrB family efflux protein